MLEKVEIERSLTAAWNLFLDKPDAINGFDLSESGFWRSFRAIVLAAPLFALAVIVQARLFGETVGDAGFWLVNALRLGLDWITFPILLAIAAKPLGLAHRYGTFIIARNWGAVLAYALAAAASALTFLGLGAIFGSLLIIAAILVSFYYGFVVARRGLDIRPGFAIGMVVADTIISLTLSEMVYWATGS